MVPATSGTAVVPPAGTTPTPRQIRFDENPTYFGNVEVSDGENEEDTNDLMGSFHTLSVSTSESQYMYGATTYECVLPFEIIVWSEPVVLTNDFRDRISFNLWLLSMADVTRNLYYTTKDS
jgi:hypothetical protein